MKKRKKPCKDCGSKKNVISRALDAAIDINSKVIQLVPGMQGIGNVGILLKDKK